MSLAKKAVFIVGAKRTPFGAFGGSLKTISATDLGVLSSQGALSQANLPASKIQETFFGNVIASSLDSSYLSRHIALKSGVPETAPALTLNRLCGSGFEAACIGAEAIEQGRISIALVGGTENMSQAPLQIDGLTARWGAQLGKGMKAEDTLWAGLTDTYAKLPMGLTAEKLGAKYGITREECDAYSFRSQDLFYKAEHEHQAFAAELVEVTISGKKGPTKVTADEHPRRATAKLSDFTKLKPVFQENGLVTAGSASGICDGAASLILADEQAVKENSLKPLTRLVAWSRVGCDPSIMGIGPVEAIRKALQVSQLTLQDMDFIEINEAFAAQYLACEKELGLDRSKVNVHGGAIALGHPLGASGARILAHLTHTLNRTKKRYAIGAACIGGGQGIAVIVENATL